MYVLAIWYRMGVVLPYEFDNEKFTKHFPIDSNHARTDFHNDFSPDLSDTLWSEYQRDQNV